MNILSTPLALIYPGAMPLIALLLITSCGESSGSAESIPLTTLVESPEQWEGSQVQVHGQLVRLVDPDGTSYGVLEDEEQNRIGLREIEPWQSLVGGRVGAEGTVEFDASFGWYLAEPRLTKAPP